VRKYKDHTANLKGHLGIINGERSALKQSMSDLQAELKSVTAERDSLRANSSTGADASRELETLRQEKATLEKALTDEKASKTISQTVPSPDQLSLVVCPIILLLLCNF
jgi:nucleoprotein TPR